MIINETEYREKTSDWCKTCNSGPEPNKQCRECMNVRVLADYNGTQFAAPTNYEERLDENSKNN